MSEAKAGDKVKVITDKEEFEGVLMPRPSILEKGFTVIKLDNGYNIGIEDKKIKQIKVLEEYSHKKAKNKNCFQKRAANCFYIIFRRNNIL